MCASRGDDTLKRPRSRPCLLFKGTKAGTITDGFLCFFLLIKVPSLTRIMEASHCRRWRSEPAFSCSCLSVGFPESCRSQLSIIMSPPLFLSLLPESNQTSRWSNICVSQRSLFTAASGHLLPGRISASYNPGA